MRAWRAILPISLLLILSACGNTEHEDIKQWMTDSSRDLRGRVPALPELKPFPVVSYDANLQADPFSADRVEPETKGGGANKPNFDRPREQLESFPLESMQFVGVVKKGDRHALINVNGVMYQARKGNYLGQNHGRIVAINESEVVIMEVVQDPSGQSADWMEKQATLQLQEGAQMKEAGK